MTKPTPISTTVDSPAYKEGLLCIPAAALLKFSTAQLWDQLEGDFILRFSDGDIVTNERETLYSSYVWEYLRRYPATPLLLKHHIRGMLGTKDLGANSHLTLINNALWSVYDAYAARVSDRRDLLDDLARMVYEVTNTMYNDLSLRCEEYVTSLDITDFIAISRHQPLCDVMESAPPTEDGVVAVTKTVEKLIFEDPLFRQNPLAVSIRNGIARTGQAYQCLGWRGFLTDMDNNIFEHPVQASYISGVRSLHDSMIESRSAAKSLINATKPLQDSEYFSRRQQLICMNVKHLHPGDCGSKHYLNWLVRDVRYEGSTRVSDGDLKTLQGKYYFDDESQALKIVHVGDKHLIGKTIKLRSIVAGCCHPDPYGVCEVCYGENALSIPKDSNLGHIACVTMTAIIGQLILSTKHYDSSSTVAGIVLGLEERKYLDVDMDGSAYRLSDKLAGKKVLIYVKQEDMPGLTDIKLVGDVSELPITRVSEFDTIWMSVTDPKRNETDLFPLKVFKDARKSSMTHELLRYIKHKGYSIRDEMGAYEFDLSEWNPKQALFVLPMVHYNMSDHQGEIAKMLEATAAQAEIRSSVVNPMSLLVDFHDLTNRRLNVNLAGLEVILYSSMVVSVSENNYDLPKPWTKSGVGVMRLLLSSRSESAQMGFQNHHNVFADPEAYVQKKRLNHIFDGLLMPELFNDPARRAVGNT